jgi:hypothetical protein
MAEILSPSNTRQEIELKQSLCHRDRAACVYGGNSRQKPQLEPVVLKRPDDAIEMPEFGLRCLVADLYRGTPLDTRAV